MSKAIQKGISVILSVGGIPLAGQENASLNQSMTPIVITNQIKKKWYEIIDGTKTWNVFCSGAYVKNDESLHKLEQAFMDNELVEVILQLDEKTCYKGLAYIVNFPLNAIYNDYYKYQISLTGSGPLELQENDNID